MGFDISVLGFGDNVVDCYDHLGVLYPGGNAVNFAVFAKGCGAARAAYMGIFGSDAPAEHLISCLGEMSVETVKCRQMIGASGMTHVALIDGDRMFLGSNEGGVRGDARFVLDRFDLEYMHGFDLVHSGNYAFTERELPKIHAAGVPVSFDFSDDSTEERFEQIAPFVTYAFMSMGAAPLDQIKAKVEWVGSLGPRIVCASRGGKGSIAYDGARFYEQGAEPVAADDLKDTMGAGDALIAAFLVAYLSREKAGDGGPDAIRACLDFAAARAAATCMVEGSWGHPMACG